MPSARGGDSQAMSRGAKRTRHADDQGDRPQQPSAYDDIRTRIVNQLSGSDDDVLDLLDQAARKWRVHEPAMTLDSMVGTFFVNFGLRFDGDLDIRFEKQGHWGLRELDLAVAEEEQRVIGIFHALKSRKHLWDEEGTRMRTAEKLMEIVFYARSVVLASFQAKRAVHEMSSDNLLTLDQDLDKLLASWSIRFHPPSSDEVQLSEQQKAQLHLLDIAYDKLYRKHNNRLYEPVFTDAGNYTHAWREVTMDDGEPLTIAKFVLCSVTKEMNMAEWAHLHKSNRQLTDVQRYLEQCNDRQLPYLRPDRGTFAFSNGVLRIEERAFYPHDSGPRLPPSVVACRYFDYPLPQTVLAAQNWRDVPTPLFDSLLSAQHFPPDVCEWAYILVGRLLYNLNVHDRWQIMPFLHGLAGTGKSTICSVVEMLYDKDDVGTLSNNIEQQFGLAVLAKKYVVIGSEIGTGLRLTQKELQMIISGERVSVAQKHQMPLLIEWVVPMIMAGNEVPEWADNSGSVQRRIVVFDFEHAIREMDTRLMDKMRNGYDVRDDAGELVRTVPPEVGPLIWKMNEAYREAAAKCEGRNVWSVLPRYFHGKQDEIAQQTNPLEGFLNSDRVRFPGPGEPADTVFCPAEAFIEALKAFSIRINARVAQTYNWNTLRQPLGKRGVRKVKEVREWRTRKKKTEYLIGVDLVDADQEDQAENLDPNCVPMPMPMLG